MKEDNKMGMLFAMDPSAKMSLEYKKKYSASNVKLGSTLENKF
jgi:hypothetical protein